jgi:hypothetical protein
MHLNVIFPKSSFKIVACALLLFSAADLLAKTRAGSMKRIMHRMTGKVEMAKETSLNISRMLETMLPKSRVSDRNLEAFASHLEKQVILSELSVREIGEQYNAFRKVELERIQREGTTAERAQGLVELRIHEVALTDRQLDQKHVREQALFEARLLGGGSKVISERVKNIEMLNRISKVAPELSAQLKRVVVEKLETIPELIMMRTMLKMALDKASVTTLKLKNAWESVLDIFNSTELWKKCKTSLKGAGGGAKSAPGLSM